MIQVYEIGHADYASMGLGSLTPVQCSVHEEQGGAYELDITCAMDEGLGFDLLMAGRVLRVPVPAMTTPMYRILGTPRKEYWISPDGGYVYNGKSTVTGGMQTVTRTRKVVEEVAPDGSPQTALSRRMDRPLVPDGGTRFTEREETYTEEVWVNPLVIILDTVAPGEEILVLNKSDPNWYQVSTPRGHVGWMQAHLIALDRVEPGAPGETVQGRKIRDQLFRIYRVEKDTKAQAVKAWARHISYDLMGNVVTAQTPETVPLGTLLDQVRTQCSQPGHRFGLHTDTPAKTIREGDYQHKNIIQALLDPDEGIRVKANARVVRDNFDIFLTTRSQTKRAPITYGRNLLGVTLEINEDSIINRIVPLGQDKDGNTVTLPEKWLDSPRNEAQTIIRARAIEYSEAREKEPREATENTPYDPGMTMAQVHNKLRELATAEFDAGIDLPEVQMKIDFLQLGDTEEYQQYRDLDRLYLGDLVQVTDLVHGIDVEAEVTEYNYDCLTGRYTMLGVGVTSATRTIGSIGAYMLPNGSIAGYKLVPGSVDGSRIAYMSIGAAKIGLAAIGSAHIEDAAIGTAKIALAAITSALIDEAAIQGAHIQDASISDAKIINLLADKITGGTLDAGLAEIININAANITVGQINGIQIADGAVDMEKLEQGVVAVIQNAQQTADGKNKIFYRTQANKPTVADGLTVDDLWFDLDNGYAISRWNGSAWVLSPLDTAAFAAGAITAEKIAAGAVNADKIAANAITAGKIATGIINSTHIGANTISGDRLVVGTVGSTYIANGAITTDKLLAGAVVGDKIAANSILAGHIVANTITGSQIKSDTIEARHLKAGLIETGHISAGARDSLLIDAQQEINLAVGGIRVGGTNLLQNSDFTQGLWASTSTATVVYSAPLYNGKNMMRITTTTAGATSSNTYVDIPYTGEANIPLALSFVVLGDSNFTRTNFPNTQAVAVVRCFDSTNTDIAGGWLAFSAAEVRSHPDFAYSRPVRVYKTFPTIPTGTAKLRILLYAGITGSYLRFAEIQVEKGTTATDWSPAPSDPASGVKTSKIEIGSDFIDIESGGNITINAGGNLNVRGGSGTSAFGISTNIAGNYMLWGGHGTPASAPLYLLRNGGAKMGGFIFRPNGNFENLNRSIYFGQWGLAMGGNLNTDPQADNFPIRLQSDVGYIWGKGYIVRVNNQNLIYLESNGNIRAAGSITGNLGVLDTTPAYTGLSALEELRWVEMDEHSDIDHSTLPPFAQQDLEERETTPEGSEVVRTIPARNLGSMVSILTRGVQELLERIESIEERINA